MQEITINNKNGVLTVSSLQVAEDFEKRHDNIVRDIESLINMIKGGLLKIEETHTKGLKSKVYDYFIETKYQHPQNKQWYKCYDITRDGFSLLVMGFTGKKALEWKLKYIEAFNSMERQLINVNSSIEEIVSRALSERTEEIVTKVLNEKLETIIVRAVKKVMAETFKEKLTEVASETAKTLIPCFEVLDRNLTGFAGHLRNNAENEKIFRLSPKLRQQIDKMIISGKYSCQQIADFITKKSGIRISPVTVNRYIKKYFVL